MANEQNLKPYKKGQISSEEAKRRGRKGGLVRNMNKKIASRLRDLKKKGLTDKNARRLYDIIADPEYSAFDILFWLEGVKKDCRTARDKTNLARARLELHKVHHGQKLKIDGGLVQNNVQIIINDDRDKYPVIDPEKK